MRGKIRTKMLDKAIKASAMVFSTMVFVAVFGLLASTHSVARAADGDVQSISRVKSMAKAAGVKSGDDLIHDSTPSSEPGDYFQPIGSQARFAHDILILTDNADKIKSETDLENYLHSETRSEHLLSFEDNSKTPSEVVAIWTVSDEDWANIAVTDERFLGAPRVIKELFQQNGIDLKSPLAKSTRDPDGSCSSAYACLRSDDGGNTGFHSAPVCYYGKWDNVWMAVNLSTNRKVSVYQTNGQMDTFEPSYGKTYSPSVYVNTVDIY